MMMQKTKEDFKSVAHCAMHYIYHFGSMWSNSRIAAEVKNIMGSNTGPGNISWYKIHLKKGNLNMEKYVDVSVPKMGDVLSANQERKTELPTVEAKEIVTAQAEEDVDLVDVLPELDALITAASVAEDAIDSNPRLNIQTLAMNFFNNRNEKNFSVLYKRIKPGMVYHVLNMLHDESLSEDVANIALAKIWQKIEQYNPHWRFSTWAYRIVTNEAMQQLRRNKPYMSIDFNNGSTGEDAVNVEYVLKKQGAKEEDVLQMPEILGNDDEDFKKSMYEKVMKDIQSLPKTYKEIMIDRELNGMKYKDIAEKYSININSVKTRIKRARMHIIGNNDEYYRIVQRKNRKRNEEKREKKINMMVQKDEMIKRESFYMNISAF